jgi:hypothetical protein
VPVRIVMLENSYPAKTDTRRLEIRCVVPLVNGL